MLALNEVQTGMAAKAFDRAWDMAVREGILELLDIESGKRLIAANVLRLSQSGEKDEWRLARGTMIQFRLYKLLMQTPANRFSVGHPSSSAVA